MLEVINQFSFFSVEEEHFTVYFLVVAAFYFFVVQGADYLSMLFVKFLVTCYLLAKCIIVEIVFRTF